jgi:methyl-accepting chemotaxis protein/uncharacterized protein (DUF2164 family)
MSQLTSLFTNMGLKTRLISGFAAMVALTFVCGALGVFMADQFKRDTTAMLDGPIAEIAEANLAWEDVLQSQNAQQQFKNTRDEVYVEQFHEYVGKAVSELSNIVEVTSNEDWRALISDALMDLDEYKTLFDQYHQIYVERGLHEKSGLEGELRAAVHTVEEDLMESGYDQLTVLLLMCRRHEKDYLMRGNREKYLGRIDQRLIEFNEAVAQLEIEEGVLNTWAENWDTYRFVLDTLADKTDELAAIEAQFIAKSEEVHQVLMSVLNSAPEIDTSAIDRAKAMSIGTLGIVLVVGVGLAFWLIRSITAPVQRLTCYAQTLASGDLRVEPLNIKSKDAIGDLSVSMETMRDSFKDIVTALHESASQVSRSAIEVSQSASDTVSGMDSQSRLVEQCSAAVIQLSSSADEVADKSKHAADHADASGESANEGSRVVESTIAGMEQISSAVTLGSESVTELGRRSEEIGEVIAVINDIADQTNLLALNAAIEAARAGEHGRGFAVVADEVRKLADRTTQATEEVEQSINAIRQDTARAVEQMHQGTTSVESGVRTTHEAGNSLTQIKSYAVELNDMVTSIAAAAREQSVASSDVSRTIQDIAGVTHEVTESARASAKSMDELSERADDLLTLAGRFKV